MSKIKVLHGKYNSSTQGLLDAVWIEIDKSGRGISNFSGTFYEFSNAKDFVNQKDDNESTVFPKVTDFFGQELLEMNIKFKG